MIQSAFFFPHRVECPLAPLREKSFIHSLIHKRRILFLSYVGQISTLFSLCGASVGGPEKKGGTGLVFSHRNGEGQVKVTEAELRGGQRSGAVRSFPGVKALLELGACVADVEALLADGVVAMETDQYGISG